MFKTYFFYFIHLFLQNTHINLSIIHIYSNKIFISLPHSHRPTPTIHIGITLESTQPISRKLEKQTQQNGWKPSYQDRRLALSNKIDASDGDGENEKQDWRFTSTPLVAMARTRNKIDATKGKRWRETFNPIQSETHWSSPFNPKTTRNKGIKNDRRQWWSAEARGRKMDEMRGRESCAPVREKGSWELVIERREKKLLKNYIHMLQCSCKYARVL